MNSSLKLFATVVLSAAALLAQQSPESDYARDAKGWTDIMPPANFAGWTRLPIGVEPLDKASQWARVGDTLLCTGKGGHEWLRMDRETRDFVLHLEFRFKEDPRGKGYNSGIFVRTAADYRNALSPWIQVQAGSPNGAFLFGVLPFEGRLRSFNLGDRMKTPPLKAPGEWNVVEVTARGSLISVWANGSVVCEYPYTTVDRGHIGLEAEFYAIEFRNMKLKSLEPASSR